MFCCCKIAFVLSDQRPCQPNLFCCYLHVHVGSMSRHRHAKSLTGKLANTKSQLPNEFGRRQRWSTCRQRSQIAKILTGSLCHSFCELIIVVGEFSLSATGPVGEFSPHTHTHTQPFNGLWCGTTRVGQYQRKHSLTPILIIGHPLRP